MALLAGISLKKACPGKAAGFAKKLDTVLYTMKIIERDVMEQLRSQLLTGTPTTCLKTIIREGSRCSHCIQIYFAIKVTLNRLEGGGVGVE